MPMGVAALPNPRRFAQILADRLLDNALSCRVEGNSRFRPGPSQRESRAVIPMLSISAPTPDQRQMDPAMEMATVMPDWAPWAMAADNALPRPSRAAKRKDMKKIPVMM